MYIPVQSCSEVVMRACQYYMCDVKPEGVVIIVNLIARVVELYPSHCPVFVQPLLPVVLRKLIEDPVSDLFLALLSTVAEFHQLEPKVCNPQLTQVFHWLVHIIRLTSTKTIKGVLEAMGQGHVLEFLYQAKQKAQTKLY